jgi:putative transposase
MPNYRREYFGTAWFFTVVTARRQPLFQDAGARACLRKAIEECRRRYPFSVNGWVLLPDHMHCIWAIHEGDADFSRRWSIIKRRFTQTYRHHTGAKPPFWEKRFWEHCIRHDTDYENHLHYIHYNPVKHGYVDSPGDWEWTSLHRYVAEGLYPTDWGACVEIPLDVGNE